MRFFRVFIFFVLLLFSSKEVLAASVTVSNIPSSLDKEQEFTVLVNVSGAASNTDNYLRGVFYTGTSTSSYFGYTLNNSSSWYNGSPSPIDPHQFFQIKIGSDGMWAGELKAKADTQSPYFKGNGEYFFKVGRYTASGTSVSDWSSSILTTIIFPTPTLTPTVTLAPTSSPTSTPTPKPSPTLKPTSTFKISPTQIVTIELTSKKSLIPTRAGKEVNNSKKLVLGEKNSSSLSITKNPESKVLSSSQNNIPKLLISIGILFLLACGILVYKNFKDQSQNE